MSNAFTGGCACGEIRYEISAEPISMLHCQCRQCQQRSGTGHGSYLAFANRNAVKLTGQATQWNDTGDAGTVKSHGFCPTCGSPISMTLDLAPDIFLVHAASLDDPSRFKPQAVTYASRGHAWDAMDASLTKFEKMPPR